uniref:Zgc:110339 n=1 Tax=Astyanax mexicanus TaxID=7994 RepID=A0A8B9GTF1_ASTMX
MALNFSNCASVLITGASRGLGLQMIKQLVRSAERPGKIIATARNPAAAQELRQIAESHTGIHVIPLDVVNEASIDTAVKEVATIVGAGGLNCLINNAAIHINSDLNSVTRDAMMKTFESNTVAPLFVTKVTDILGKLTKSARDQISFIVIVTSNIYNFIFYHKHCTRMLGSKTMYFCCIVPVKSGLNMVTRCLATDLESDGILCTVLHPGWVRTDMGGPDAPLSAEESISSLLSIISGLTDKDHGEFLDYTGKKIPW